MATLSLRRVFKRFQTTEVIHGVDLDIQEGEFVVFVGPSGCGKSTLLRMIAGLEEITAGEFQMNGQRMNEVQPAKRQIAMVFQSYALYPHMSVYDNLAFGLRTAGEKKEVVESRVAHAAALLRIEPYLQRKPKALSGGQRQRVAIGRAIVREPQLFLFDEPLSNLDAELRVQMRVELSKLHAKLGTTMIYVTHDQIEAMTMADRIVVLRDGVIEQTGSPLELYNRPANQFVAGFIGSPKMNFLNAKLVSQSQSATLLELAGGRQLSVKAIGRTLEVGSSVVVGIRPEHMQLGEGALEAKVEIIEQLGGNTVIYASLPDGQSLVAQVVGQSLITRDATVNLSWPTEQCHVFDSQGLTLTNS